MLHNFLKCGGAVRKVWDLPLAWVKRVLKQGSMTLEHNSQSTELIRKWVLGTTDAYRKKRKRKKQNGFKQAFPLPRDWWQKLSCYKHMSDGNIRHETKIIHCLISSKISPSHGTQVIKIIQYHSQGQNLCSTHFLNFHVPSKELPRTGTWWMLLALLVCSLTPSVNIP